jgi:hypothetical protein
VFGTFGVGTIDINASTTRQQVAHLLNQSQAAGSGTITDLDPLQIAAAHLSLDFQTLSVVIRASHNDATHYVLATYCSELLCLRRHELTQIALHSAKISLHLYHIEQCIADIQTKCNDIDKTFEQFRKQYQVVLNGVCVHEHLLHQRGN